MSGLPDSHYTGKLSSDSNDLCRIQPSIDRKAHVPAVSSAHTVLGPEVKWAFLG